MKLITKIYCCLVFIFICTGCSASGTVNNDVNSDLSKIGIDYSFEQLTISGITINGVVRSDIIIDFEGNVTTSSNKTVITNIRNNNLRIKFGINKDNYE